MTAPKKNAPTAVTAEALDVVTLFKGNDTVNSTPAFTQEQPKAADLKSIQRRMRDISSMSNDSLQQIIAIATMASTFLETPEGCRRLDTLAFALCQIAVTAEMLHNDISWHAEESGCCYTDEAQRRRWEAQRAHHERVQQDAAKLQRPAASEQQNQLAEVEVSL